jgi:hypothetical protein
MPDLPQLFPHDEAILEIEWENLKRERDFDGGHLKWPDDPQRRLEAARPPYSLPSPPPPPTDSMYGRFAPPESHTAYLLAQAEQTWKDYQAQKDRYEAEWAARVNDPAVIDTIGIRETTELAAEHFGQIFEVYRPLRKTAMVRLILQEESGRKELAGEYNWLRNYSWLEEIGSWVSDKSGEPWRPRGLWYDRVCKPEVNAKLKDCIATCRDKLRDEDLLLRKIGKDICSGRQSYDDTFAQFLVRRSWVAESLRLDTPQLPDPMLKILVSGISDRATGAQEAPRRKRGHPPAIPTDNGVGEELEERRHQKRSTVEQFACLFGLATSTYQNVESGKGGSIKTLRKIDKKYKEHYPNESLPLLEKLINQHLPKKPT